MAERGHRTTLSFGGVKAEVSLLKTSGSPREARYDVRRGDAPGPRQQAREARERQELAEAEQTKAAPPPDDTDPLSGDDMAAALADVKEAVSASEGSGLPRTALDDVRGAIQGSGELTPPEPVYHGVWREVGDEDEEWVDLTERLEAIDASTKLQAMEVVATIPSPAVPRERVRDAHWVALADPEGGRVLALLWHGLHAAGRVAVLRWTKRSNQALGILVARTLPDAQRALLVLELEWAQNMRAPSPRVTGPILAEVSEGEANAAEGLVLALAARPTELDRLRDERTSQRADLLEAARAGTLASYEPPAADPAPDDGVVARFARAAAAQR